MVARGDQQGRGGRGLDRGGEGRNGVSQGLSKRKGATNKAEGRSSKADGSNGGRSNKRWDHDWRAVQRARLLVSVVI